MSQETTSLAIMERAAILVAEANTVQEAQELRNKFLTAADWARRNKLGQETIHKAEVYARRCQDKIGTMLLETRDHRAKGAADGTPGPGRGNVVPTRNRVLSNPTFKAMGLTKRQAMEAQRLAALDTQLKEPVLRGEIKFTEAKRRQRNATIQQKIADLPPGQFRVIYADPPWRYSDQRQTGDHRETTAAAEHYPTMTFAEIGALDVKSLSAPDAVLFLWATFPLLPEQLKIVSAWGFTYKTAFVWHKGRGTFGHYHDASAELLVIATRGSCTPELDIRLPQVQTYKSNGHSTKPPDWRAMIDRLYPSGPRIELFARGAIPSPWVAWGAESGQRDTRTRRGADCVPAVATA